VFQLNFSISSIKYEIPAWLREKCGLDQGNVPKAESQHLTQKHVRAFEATSVKGTTLQNGSNKNNEEETGCSHSEAPTCKELLLRVV
jgi:hypothetical protein